MGSTKHDQTRAIGMTAARTDAPTQARGVRALWRVRQAQHGDLLATRRYDAAELASFVRPHTPLTRTLDLARSLEPRPRAQARAHPAGASSTDELADLLEPIVMPIAIGLRARSVACLHRRRPALFACGLLVLLLSGAGMAAPRMRRPDRRAPAAVQPTPAPLARERAAAPPAEPAQAAAATVSTKPEPAPEATPADAIGSLAGARYGEALARYQQLARAQPTRPAYAAVVAILKRKLATYCAQHGALGDEACGPAR